MQSKGFVAICKTNDGKSIIGVFGPFDTLSGARDWIGVNMDEHSDRTGSAGGESQGKPLQVQYMELLR